LRVYGAIDEAVSNSGSAAVAETVERYLPGTTGVGQRGWYGEIQRLAARLPRDADDEPLRFPRLDTAFKDLTQADVGVPEDDETLSTRDAANLLYATTILRKIGVEEVGDEHLEGCLNLVRPEQPAPDATRQFKGLVDDITGREQWSERMQSASADNLVSPAAACVEQPCTGSLRKVNGEYCSVLTTEFDDETVSVDQMKNVVDPLNWHLTCSFFRSMTPPRDRPINDQGWSRVMEEVGTDFRLKTALKYWKGVLPDGGIFVNYDLDDDRTGDDGLVQVDSGYIVVQPLVAQQTSALGVRVHTSKEVRIQGVSPTATAAMSCLLGWADMGREMLLNATKIAPERLTKWSASKELAPPVKTVGRDRVPPLTVPQSVRADLIETTASGMKDYLFRVEDWVDDFIDKWRNGLTPDEIDELGADLGHEITQYWRSAFTRAVDTVRPRMEGTKDE
jgi:hypothetical protein